MIRMPGNEESKKQGVNKKCCLACVFECKEHDLIQRDLMKCEFEDRV